MQSTTRDMTYGSPWRLIVSFAVPVLLSQVFQQLYNTADTLIVGRFLGDGALAAVSSSGPLIFLLISFFVGVTMGASVTISRYFGAGDHDACFPCHPYKHPRQHVQRYFADGLRRRASRRRSCAGWGLTRRFCRRPSPISATTSYRRAGRRDSTTPARAS